VWDLINFLRTVQGEKPIKSDGNKTGGAQP
jgi:hypothetical protein